MDAVEQINYIYIEAKRSYNIINTLIKERPPELTDDYKKLNFAYFRVCEELYISFLFEVHQHRVCSAIILLRSLLEIYTKSYYLELIEKNKNADVENIISDPKAFPSFVKMTTELDNYKSEAGHHVAGMFKQFTKASLGSYEKYSLFTHGRGELIRAFMGSSSVKFDEFSVKELLLTAKGLFETLSALYFYVQQQEGSFKKLLKEISTHQQYKGKV